jgi:hypothetical protein
MDTSALAASATMAKAGGLQQAIANRVLKMNLDAQAQVLTLLQPAAQPALSLANVGAGVGGAVNLSV